uniref:non-specific serine/threonine protein kinase n=1 Tax=Euplotes crassus TaxID=5936 RepID=A0A7S3NRC8_EUPCR|mmetsp:Transcript_2377/g.2237  ORF Transcript_2377/g.2237 Transcript_2377/m.2237 type:complete len:504 (+) Transcript_2377:25-1536(+)|eukprot:CAMPEP_0197004802 /NCGR_PEP_ID=MMETSP1380-20130617/25699_1 /TAXON_ID=5936 /ORGANISM="Euplotes crassus, Strain CT5" /LENGTH=503 /DNA_ID=CAMNT_0042423717 /DNA_START=25 /DNA_END=1536 /DNA_ORIENTATION=+
MNDKEPQKVFVEEFMTEEEEKKEEFDVEEAMNNFVIKKDYFVLHRDGDIFKDYEVEETPIGEGGFGCVYRAKEKETGALRAIKKIPTEKIINHQSIINETTALKNLDHPNIIKLYETYQDSDGIYLVQEFCEGGELFDYIAERDHLSEKEAADIFKQMMQAIIYCHKNRICHRDLKPDNFMFSSKEEGSTVKLIDFGLSRSFYKFQRTGEGKCLRMQTKVGTAHYMAPEILSQDYSYACDTWSAGVILYIMLCGYPPFIGNDEEEVFKANLEGNYDFNDKVWDDISEDAKDLISKILVPEKERLTPKECLSHPWVKETAHSEISSETKQVYLGRLRRFQNASRLKKAILSYLASRVTEEEIKENIMMFNSIDKNHDGYITLKELHKGLNSTDMDPKEIETILMSVDTDNNGAINFNEFIASTLDVSIYKDYDKLEKAFKFFDKDCDGVIDEKELKESLAGGEFEHIDTKIFSNALEDNDINQDGKVDFNEFLRCMSVKLEKEI